MLGSWDDTLRVLSWSPIYPVPATTNTSTAIDSGSFDITSDPLCAWSLPLLFSATQMLSFMRTQVSRTNTASRNPLTFQDGRAEMIFYNPGAPYMMTNIIPPGESFFNPPLHLHLFQTELFHIQSGTAAFYLRPSSKNPGPTLITAGGKIEIPRRAYHRFENGSKTEKLVIDLRLDPQRWDAEECFFRNFFGYMEDCSKTKQAPSLFQLLRFLYGNDTPLAIPVPEWCPDWVGLWVSRAFLLVAGVLIGEWVLGYKASYPEYYRKRTE